MLTKKELKEMIAKQINESEIFNPSDHPLTTRKQDRKARDAAQLSDEEMAKLQDLQFQQNYGVLTRDDKAELLRLRSLVPVRKRAGEEGGPLDPEAAGRAAADARALTEPRALASLGRSPRSSVDPYGKTHPADPLESDTIVVPRLRQENKTITQSRLRQIIKEELMVILTDDEVEEMFGIDPGEAFKEA